MLCVGTTIEIDCAQLEPIDVRAYSSFILLTTIGRYFKNLGGYLVGTRHWWSPDFEGAFDEIAYPLESKWHLR
ncbi:hypothetical protein CCP3SC1AL1_250012 [Gammaproteobacteria bacterium]